VSNPAASVERWLAWRYLATRQREGFVSFIAIFSLIGVALGVATLIVVLSVMGGFRQQLLGRIIGLNGHIVLTGVKGTLEATPQLLARLKAIPGVQAVRPTLERQALISANGLTRGALVRGVRPEDLQSRDLITQGMVHGDLSAFGSKPGAIMGDRLRQALGIRAGDKVTLVTHRLNDSGTIAPRYTDYDLLGSFLTRRYEFDGSLVFVPLAALQEDLEYGPQAVTSIDIDIADPQAAPRMAEEVRKTVARDDIRVAHWLGLNARFVGALQVERVMMFIILTLIVVVAAMNVVASFTMLVRVKRGSIAILRTMGAPPRTIVRAFFLSAAAVGLVGTAVGAALGLLVCANMPTIGALLSRLTGAAGSGGAEVDFITSMPVRVDPVEIAMIVGVALVLSLVAAAYPAWRSTRIEPVEGLRHE
jgi:lipoprotein-releasing system permease protein